jgi:hypothetical protein
MVPIHGLKTLPWLRKLTPLVLRVLLAARNNSHAGSMAPGAVRRGRFFVVPHRPAADPQRMKHLLDCHRVVGTEVGFPLMRRGYLSTDNYRKYRFGRNLTWSAPACRHGSSMAPEHAS